MGRSHMASGALVGVLVAWAADMDPAQTAAFAGITTVSALLPDFDHPDARGPRYFGWPGQVVAWVINRVFGHRGLTHSLAGVAVLTVALAFIPGVPTWVAAAVVLGCVTHIIGDMATVSGVPLFWPAERRYRIGVMRTGGFFETAILCPVMIAATAALAGGLTFGVL